MAVFWPTPGYKRRAFELWVLNRRVFKKEKKKWTGKQTNKQKNNNNNLSDKLVFDVFTVSEWAGCWGMNATVLLSQKPLIRIARRHQRASIFEVLRQEKEMNELHNSGEEYATHAQIQI